MSDYVRSCPNCGNVNSGEPYDIGSGPEFCCVVCDWCWGAKGQDLFAMDLRVFKDRIPGWEPPTDPRITQ